MKPETLIGWHRRAFQLFWRWKSHGGRPRLPRDLRALIIEMVRENPIWGASPSCRGAGAQTWHLPITPNRSSLLAGRSEAKQKNIATLEDFYSESCTSHRDLRFCGHRHCQLPHPLVVMEIGSRKLLHLNVTPHPTSSWTLQQLERMVA